MTNELLEQIADSQMIFIGPFLPRHKTRKTVPLLSSISGAIMCAGIRINA